MLQQNRSLRVLFLAYRFWYCVSCHEPYRCNEQTYASNECQLQHPAESASGTLCQEVASSDVVNVDRCRRGLAWSWAGFMAHQSFAIFWIAGVRVPRDAPLPRVVQSFLSALTFRPRCPGCGEFRECSSRVKRDTRSISPHGSWSTDLLTWNIPPPTKQSNESCQCDQKVSRAHFKIASRSPLDLHNETRINGHDGPFPSFKFACFTFTMRFNFYRAPGL